MAVTKPDFNGYVTKFDVQCTDGLTILKDAFKHNDGAVVPLVWAHLHNSPENVLGYVSLENRDDGVFGHGFLNDTPNGVIAKGLVKHRDIRCMSIYANQVTKVGNNVVHGDIKEVSLVLAGANPGATIDPISITHSDGSETLLDNEAIFRFESPVSYDEEIQHSEDSSISEIYNTLNEDQKKLFTVVLAQAIEAANSEVSQSEDLEENNNEEGENLMHTNVFEKPSTEAPKTVLSHDALQTIAKDAENLGSFKKAILAHAQEYGITNIGELFPDYKNVRTTPDFIKRDDEWVAGVLSGVHHVPFTRIKSMTADITADTARAKGYLKGNMKKEEFFSVAKRVTDAWTVYKKQKFDRDDLIDVTDFNVVSWVQGEMRAMLNEELARAFLIGDGREPDDPDRIHPDYIRPIATDKELYTVKVDISAAAQTDYKKLIKEIAFSKPKYKGSGSPTFYTDTMTHLNMLWVEDENGRRIYETDAALCAALGCKNIVDVDLLEGFTVTDTDKKTSSTLYGIMVNLSDYSVGTNKGGQIASFDDFDIDYNQYRYLLETRLSAALTKPHSAMAFWKTVSTGG